MISHLLDRIWVVGWETTPALCCRFIDAICDTALMKEAHEFLRLKGKAPGGLSDFKKLLYKLWFKLYRRTKGDR